MMLFKKNLFLAIRHRKIIIICFVLLALMTIPHLITFGYTRIRIPYDILLMINSSIFINFIYERYKIRRDKSLLEF